MIKTSWRRWFLHFFICSDEKQKNKINFESKCNAVAIEYYDYEFDKDFNNFGYEFKKCDIYKEHVLVYNDGSRTLHLKLTTI